jgi:RimJ/RimL family protein N-acetyltransferase
VAAVGTPVLVNDRVRLEPLALQHAADLQDAVGVDDLWRTWYTHIPSPKGMSRDIARRLELQQDSRMAPWAVADARSGRAVGMTTFYNLDPANRRLEIGSTWLGRTAQRTGINSAAKLLLLTRAFDDLYCIAVEFRAHWHNHQSREAIARLGAKQDGVRASTPSSTTAPYETPSCLDHRRRMADRALRAPSPPRAPLAPPLATRRLTDLLLR